MKRYALLVEADVHAARKRLPGNVRQRIKQSVGRLAQSPRPTDSRPLDVTGLVIPPGVELRRLRVNLPTASGGASEGKTLPRLLHCAGKQGGDSQEKAGRPVSVRELRRSSGRSPPPQAAGLSGFFP